MCTDGQMRAPPVFTKSATRRAFLIVRNYDADKRPEGVKRAPQCAPAAEPPDAGRPISRDISLRDRLPSEWEGW